MCWVQGGHGQWPPLDRVPRGSPCSRKRVVNVPGRLTMLRPYAMLPSRIAGTVVASEGCLETSPMKRADITGSLVSSTDLTFGGLASGKPPLPASGLFLASCKILGSEAPNDRSVLMICCWRVVISQREKRKKLEFTPAQWSTVKAKQPK